MDQDVHLCSTQPLCTVEHRLHRWSESLKWMETVSIHLRLFYRPVIPLHQQIFIGHRSKKHICLSFLRVYQCNAWYCHHHEHIYCSTSTSDTVSLVCGHGIDQIIDIDKFALFPLYSSFLLNTSISANADGLRDAASRKIDHIALPTKYNYQATSIG